MPPSKGTEDMAIRQQDEFQEMLGHPPGWILHSGITVIAFVAVITLLLSWLVRYPDEIPARVVIQQARPPHELRPLISGRIDTLLQPGGGRLEAGERAAILESAANWRHVDSLQKLLVKENDPVEWPGRLQLGDLQPFYAAFLQAYDDWHFFSRRTIFESRKLAAEREITALRELESAYLQQRRFFLQEKALIENKMERARLLHEDGVSSTVELEEQQMQLLQYEQQLQNLETTILQNHIRAQQLEAALAENRDQYLQSQNTLSLALEQARRQLQGALEEWESHYILKSPVPGRLELPEHIAGHYTLQAGELLGMVVPEGGGGSVVAHLRLAATGLGKVTVGAPVKISLDAYPEQEFGQIAATVDEIGLSPLKNEEGELEYAFRAHLADTLRTSYGKHIPLAPSMPGTATIITKDRRILERILQQFMDIFKNR